MRFCFPSRGHWTDPTLPPIELARRLAELIEAADPVRVSVGHINWTIRAEAPDPGDLGGARGEPLPGERLSEWLTLYEGPGGRTAYLEIDLQAFGRWKANHDGVNLPGDLGR